MDIMISHEIDDTVMAFVSARASLDVNNPQSLRKFLSFLEEIQSDAMGQKKSTIIFEAKIDTLLLLCLQVGSDVYEDALSKAVSDAIALDPFSASPYLARAAVLSLKGQDDLAAYFAIVAMGLDSNPTTLLATAEILQYSQSSENIEQFRIVLAKAQEGVANLHRRLQSLIDIEE